MDKTVKGRSEGAQLQSTEFNNSIQQRRRIIKFQYNGGKEKCQFTKRRKQKNKRIQESQIEISEQQYVAKV